MIIQRQDPNLRSQPITSHDPKPMIPANHTGKSFQPTIQTKMIPHQLTLTSLPTIDITQ